MYRQRNLRWPSAIILLAMLAGLQHGFADQPETVAEHDLEINGLNLHVREAGSGPLVILLHGFPEYSFAWRHQLPKLAEAGYRVVAPDLRGFGQSDQPSEQASYSMEFLCDDLIGLIDHYEETRAVVVGHDWGAAVAWSCAQVYPERYRAMVSMSVPYSANRSDVPPLERIRAARGENFFYMLYFQEDRALQELENRTGELFEKIFQSPGADRLAPSIIDPLASAGGWLDRIGEPLEEPDWIGRNEIDQYIATYEVSGFLGGINYYRNLDQNWAWMAQQDLKTLNRPALFIAGSEDFFVKGESEDSLREQMAPVTPTVEVKLLQGTGHWLLAEAPELVNEALLAFLERVERAVPERCGVEIAAHGVVVQVTNLELAKSFYADKLKLPWQELAPGLVLADMNLPVYFRQASGGPAPAFREEARAGLVFMANDLESTTERWRRLGVGFLYDEPETVGVGFSNKFRDPDGTVHSLLQQTRPAPDPFPEPRIYNFGFDIANLEAGLALYVENMGFKVRTMNYYPPAVPLGTKEGDFAFMLHVHEHLRTNTASLDSAGTRLIFQADSVRELKACVADHPGIRIERHDKVPSVGEQLILRDSEGVLSEFWQSPPGDVN